LKLLLEQFNNTIPKDIAVWLLDHKPATITEAARKADEYVAVRKPLALPNKVEENTSVNVNFRNKQSAHTQTLTRKCTITMAMIKVINHILNRIQVLTIDQNKTQMITLVMLNIIRQLIETNCSANTVLSHFTV
jgi:hypothetical protein